MAGLEDADDCDWLCGDGILKMCTGRSASDETRLASRPTMTHLESRLSRKEPPDIGECLIDGFIASKNCPVTEHMTNCPVVIMDTCRVSV